MTDYWKSAQTKWWCEACRCWVDDTVRGRAVHEIGGRHKAAIAQRLREARRGAERDARVQLAVGRIEAAAQRQFEGDVRSGLAPSASGPASATPRPPPPALGVTSSSAAAVRRAPASSVRTKPSSTTPVGRIGQGHATLAGRIAKAKAKGGGLGRGRNGASSQRMREEAAALAARAAARARVAERTKKSMGM